MRLLEGERIHRADALELYAIDRDFIGEWASRLTRRMSLALTVTDGHLYLAIGDTSLTGTVERITLPR